MPEQVRYRYKLERYDTEWQEAGLRRQAFYTNPGPGSYRFRVKAENSDGVWNESGASIEFSIAFAFYETLWFRFLGVLTAGGIAWLLYLFRLRLVTAQLAARLGERLQERERIARELHDTLLQSFQGLMLRLQVVDELLPPGKAKEQLEKSLERADQAIAEGRDAVQNLRSSPAANGDLAEALRTIASEFVGDARPIFRLLVEGEARDLDPILLDEIYRIACEGLRNAFNHAQAAHIEVEIAYDKHVFRLRIRDDGGGIPLKTLEAGRSGHYGLNGMRERARQTGAKFDIWSSAGNGTEIDLSFPGSIAYASAPRRFRLGLFRRKVE
jgi:signal transduction histidine kinase